MPAAPSLPSSAQQAAEVQAREFARQFAGHNSLLQSLSMARAGVAWPTALK